MISIDDILRHEQRVKDICSQDKTNPELYDAIKDLSEAILILKGMVDDKRSIDEMSHQAAVELFQKVTEEGLEVEKWTAYLRKYLLGVRREYRGVYNQEVIETDDVLDYEKIRSIFYAGSYSLTKGFEESEIKSFVADLPKMIRRAFKNICKFSPDYIYYDNLYLSIICSIVNEEVVIYGNLPEALYPYVSFLYKVIKEKIKIHVIEYLGGSGYEGIYSDIVSYNSFDIE